MCILYLHFSTNSLKIRRCSVKMSILASTSLLFRVGEKMDFSLMQYIATPLQNIQLIILAINIILHIIFAGAVAKDAGNFEKMGAKTSLVSGIIWAFATLIGGIFIAAIYWLIHHSTFTRADYKERI